MLIRKAVSLILLLSLIIVMFSSCKKSVNDMAKNEVFVDQNYNSNVVIEDTSITTHIDVDKVLYALNKIINDDIWYKGKNSRLYGLEGTILSLEIYGRLKEDKTIYVCLKDEFKSNEKKGYIAVGLNKYGDGYANYIETFFFKDTYELVVGKVKESEYTLALSTTIKIENTTRPDFMPQSPVKEQIVSAMLLQSENYIRKVIRSKKDQYKIQIIDFRQSDYMTKAIIENQNGEIWILELFGTGGERVKYGEAHSVKEFPVLLDSVINYRKEIVKETFLER